jgi:hypothetical protein
MGNISPYIIVTHGGGPRMLVSAPAVMSVALGYGMELYNNYTPAAASGGLELSAFAKPAHAAVGFINGSSDTMEMEQNEHKDIYASAEATFGPANLGGYFYSGKDRNIDDEFMRYGGLGDVLLMDRLYLHGAFIFGKHGSIQDENAEDINNMGLYVEADYLLTDILSASFRLDRVDPNTDVDENETTWMTGGAACNFSRYARGLVEWQNTKTGEADAVNYLTIGAEWMY